MKENQSAKNKDHLNREGSFLNSNPETQLYWNKEAEKIKMSEEGFWKNYKRLAKEGYIASKGTKTMIRDWPLGSLRLDVRKFSANLFVRQFDGKLKWFYYTSKSADSSKKSEKVGGNARKILNEWLKFNDLPPLKKIFGLAEIQFKNCIPRGFYYIDSLKNDRFLEHMNCIDACSQYPSGFIGKLPDRNQSKAFKGTVKPTEDYPFAFYINSGHLAIYGEFDTHDWLNSEFAKELCPEIEDGNPDSKCIHHHYRLNPSKDLTILMKAADSNPLEKFFEELFEIKESKAPESEDYKAAKLVLNSLIGCMHYKDFFYNKTDFRLAHLAAVAIARGNDKLLKLAEKVGKEKIAMIVVDSIIYEGTAKLGEDRKRLGHFHQEICDADYQQRKISVYMFMKDDKCIKFKHGAFNADADGNEIATPTTTAEMYGWKRIEIKEKKDEKTIAKAN